MGPAPALAPEPTRRAPGAQASQQARRRRHLRSSMDPPARLREFWFPAAFSGALAAGAALPFELLGEAWVLFRDAAGMAACVRDECAHRACPLSLVRAGCAALQAPRAGRDTWEADQGSGFSLRAKHESMMWQGSLVVSRCRVAPVRGADAAPAAAAHGIVKNAWMLERTNELCQGRAGQRGGRPHPVPVPRLAVRRARAVHRNAVHRLLRGRGRAVAGSG